MNTSEEIKLLREVHAETKRCYGQAEFLFKGFEEMMAVLREHRGCVEGHEPGRARMEQTLLRELRKLYCQFTAADLPTLAMPTAPSPVASADTARQPSPGPWTVTETVKLFGAHLALYLVNDRDGNPVSGVYVLAGIGCTDAELANVAAVLAVPIMLDALREIATESASVNDGFKISCVDTLRDFTAAVDSITARAFAAATPIGRKPATPEGGGQ